MTNTANILNRLDQELQATNLDADQREALSDLRDRVMLKHQFDTNPAFREALCDHTFNLTYTVVTA